MSCKLQPPSPSPHPYSPTPSVHLVLRRDVSSLCNHTSTHAKVAPDSLQLYVTMGKERILEAALTVGHIDDRQHDGLEASVKQVGTLQLALEVCRPCQHQARHVGLVRRDETRRRRFCHLHQPINTLDGMFSNVKRPKWNPDWSCKQSIPPFARDRERGWASHCHSCLLHKPVISVAHCG